MVQQQQKFFLLEKLKKEGLGERPNYSGARENVSPEWLCVVG